MTFDLSQSLSNGLNSWYVSCFDGAKTNTSETRYINITYQKEVYVDNQLGSICSGNYSIASRDCSGSDGDGFNIIQDAINNISAPSNIQTGLDVILY